MSERVRDCPEPCACYAEGYAQSKRKAYFEMSNFDWTNHAKGCECQPCSAFAKVLVRMIENMATGEDRKDAWSHITSQPGYKEHSIPGSSDNDRNRKGHFQRTQHPRYSARSRGKRCQPVSALQRRLLLRVPVTAKVEWGTICELASSSIDNHVAQMVIITCRSRGCYGEHFTQKGINRVDQLGYRCRR